MTRRQVIKLGWLIGLLVIIIAVVTIRRLGAPIGNNKPVQSQPIKIGVSQTPLSSPLIVAKSLGLFKLQGLNVELVPCNGGVACVNDLFNHHVEYATASESVVMFRSFHRDDFVIVSSFVSSDNDVKLLAFAHNGAEHISDLVGKKIGVIKASASEFYLDSVLIASGLNTDEVTKIYYPPERLDQALINHSVDAISVWEPWGYKIKMGVDREVTNLGLAGIYDLSFNLIAMKDDAKHRQAQDLAILEALRAANLWIDQHPDKAQQVIASKLGLEQRQLDWSWQDYSFRLSLGNSILTNLELQARWAMDNKLVSGMMPDYRNFLDSHALKQLIRLEQGEVVK